MKEDTLAVFAEEGGGGGRGGQELFLTKVAKSIGLFS
jgi:hypothetical protein